MTQNHLWESGILRPVFWGSGKITCFREKYSIEGGKEKIECLIKLPVAHCLLLRLHHQQSKRTEAPCCPSADLFPYQVFYLCARTFVFLSRMLLMLIITIFHLSYLSPRSTLCFSYRWTSSIPFKTGGLIF